VATAAQLGQRSGQAKPTVLRGLAKLTELGIVREITGRAKRRVFAYEDYLAILSEGTEPL
jgi:predicted transcriptional regulator